MFRLRKIVLICFALCGLLCAEAQVNFGAAVAFSLRRIVPTYTGSAIQVRRSSDNTTQNIGFTACGYLDTASLKTFVGANSGFVSTWYDQSGNARDASQGTAASQPRIVNAGAVDYVNKRPTIVWPGTNSSGIYLSYGSNVTFRTVNAVRDFKLNPFASSPDNMQYLFSCPANGDYSVRLSSAGNFSYDGDNNVNDWINGSGTPKLCWVNGTQTTTSQYALHCVTATGPSTVNGSFSIGSTFSNRDLFDNDAVSELVAYSGTITNTQRTLIETCEAVIYSVTISNSKYTPPSPALYISYINGAGRESATDSVSGTRSSKGMGFKIGSTAADFLKDNGDYITAGMDCPLTNTSTANLPVAVQQRWANDWYINKTDISSNGGNLSIYFDFSEYGIGGTPGTAANYVLLGRNSTASTFSVVPGTTITVSGNKVLFAISSVSISNDAYYTIGSTNVLSSPLPVELGSFQCSQAGNDQVLLSWTTLTEHNNDYFLAERSADGINYGVAGKIKGAGNSITVKAYEFRDEGVEAGNFYYRLKQVNYDGSFKVYDPCFVNAQGSAELLVFPNPAGDYLDIASPSASRLITVSVSDGSSKLIQQAQFSGQGRLSLAALPDGFYMVQIDDGYSTTVKKLLVQH